MAQKQKRTIWLPGSTRIHLESYSVPPSWILGRLVNLPSKFSVGSKKRKKYMFWKLFKNFFDMLSGCLYSVSKKTGPLQLISHNFTNSQNSLTIFWTEIPYWVLRWYDKKFLNWLRTSCVVSITTVANRRIWTAYFWADFEQRIIGSAINEWQNDCGAVSMPKDSIRRHVVTFDTANILLF